MRTQHKRGPEYGSQTDFHLFPAGPEKNSDNRNRCFGQGRPDGREDTPDGAFGNIQTLSEPLNAVREEMAPGQGDNDRGHE